MSEDKYAEEPTDRQMLEEWLLHPSKIYPHGALRNLLTDLNTANARIKELEGERDWLAAQLDDMSGSCPPEPDGFCKGAKCDNDFAACWLAAAREAVKG